MITAFIYGRTPFPAPPPYAGHMLSSQVGERMLIPSYRLGMPQMDRKRADSRPDHKRTKITLRSHRGGR